MRLSNLSIFCKRSLQRSNNIPLKKTSKKNLIYFCLRHCFQCLLTWQEQYRASTTGIFCLSISNVPMAIVFKPFIKCSHKLCKRLRLMLKRPKYLIFRQNVTVHNLMHVFGLNKIILSFPNRAIKPF